jgi:hypothetical protein
VNPEEEIAGALSAPQEQILARLREEHPVGCLAHSLPSRSLAALARRGLVRGIRGVRHPVIILTPEGERVAESLWSPCEDCGERTPP